MEGKALVAGVSDAGAVPLRRGRPRERRGRRLRDEEVDPPPARGRRRGGDGLPAHGRRRRRSRGYDGVVLSNGPGDPDPLVEETAVVRDLLGRAPVFGICLGHQLLGLATGHETFKLPFGHRGANHPVLERESGRVLVTSQNHGFAVKPTEDSEATAISLYDGTVEGFDFPDLDARSVQFHPEAGPGPHDGWPLLETWVEELAAAELTSSRSA